MEMQLFKNKAIDFIKSTKNNLSKLYSISEFHNTKKYYIYNGKLLKTDCFNIQYSLVHNVVNTNVLKKDEVYIIREVDNKNNLFNLFGQNK
jgi:hypothetical protein